MLRSLLLLSALGPSLIFATAHGYIPPTETILKKTLDFQAAGGWRVRLKVYMADDMQNQSFEEVWTVADADSMRVKVTGATESNKSFSRDYVYQRDKRYRINENGELVVLTMTPAFFERVFHFVQIDDMKRYLIDADILTKTESKAEPAKAGESPQFAYEKSPRVRLGRFGGVVNYVFGVPTPLDAAEPLSGLWIEQDKFQMRRLRLPPKSEMAGELLIQEYKKFGPRWFPESRILKWRQHTVHIVTQGIERINIGPVTKKFLQPEALKEAKKPAVAEEALDFSMMTEFYKRFR